MDFGDDPLRLFSFFFFFEKKNIYQSSAKLAVSFRWILYWKKLFFIKEVFLILPFLVLHFLNEFHVNSLLKNCATCLEKHWMNIRCYMKYIEGALLGKKLSKWRLKNIKLLFYSFWTPAFGRKGFYETVSSVCQ